jgi:hypothetical protein
MSKCTGWCWGFEKKCFLSSPVVKPRLRLGQKTFALFGFDTQICNYLVSYAGRHPQNINMIIEKICFNLLLIFHLIFFRFPDFIERGRRETS